jgi:hypothetical protein
MQVVRDSRPQDLTWLLSMHVSTGFEILVVDDNRKSSVV